MAIKLVSVTDARTNFSELIGRAQYGDEPTIITHHDKPVAIVFPFEAFRESDAFGLAEFLGVGEKHTLYPGDMKTAAGQIAETFNYIKEKYGVSEETAKPEAEPFYRSAKQVIKMLLRQSKGDTPAAKLAFNDYVAALWGDSTGQAEALWTEIMENLNPSLKASRDDEKPEAEPPADKPTVEGLMESMAKGEHVTPAEAEVIDKIVSREQAAKPPVMKASGSFVISPGIHNEMKKLAAKFIKRIKQPGDILAAKLAFDELVKAEYPESVPFADTAWKEAERQYRLGLE